MLSKHRCISSSRLPQTTKQVLRRYPAHVAGLVKVGCWSGGVAFGFSSVAFDEDAGDDEEKDGAQGAGKGDEDDKAESQMATLMGD